MKYFSTFVVAASFLFLTACATPYDVDIARSNNATVQNHSTQQGKVAIKKAEAITGIFNKLSEKCQSEDSFSCGALLGMSGAMASRDIASIKTEEYAGPVQKTGVDVQNNAVDKVGAGIPIAGMVVVSNKAIDKDKGVVNNDASNGSAVTNSYDEDHATSVGTGDGSPSATNTPSGNHEEIVPAEETVPTE